MHVLVAFGSKRGGTEGLAHWLAAALRTSGHVVDVRPADEPDGLEVYDAVIVGGALYANRWHKSARRFVQRHADELSHMPVWFFSSGPLDDSARGVTIAPTGQVTRLMRLIGAREHVTFGGRLAAEATGPIARATVRQGPAGDFRDPQRVRSWAERIAEGLSGLMKRGSGARVDHVRARRHVRNAITALCWLSGLWMLGGGIELISRRDARSWFAAPGSLLDASHPYALPASLLLLVVGAWNIVAGVFVIGRRRSSELFALVGGLMLVTSASAAIAVLRAWSWHQGALLMLGLSIAALAFGLRRMIRASVRAHE